MTASAKELAANEQWWQSLLPEERYRLSIEAGLSDAEAREDGWPADTAPTTSSTTSPVEDPAPPSTSPPEVDGPAPANPLLPAVLANGVLDVEQLDGATKGLRAMLEEQVRGAAHLTRQARQLELGDGSLQDTDVAPLVRRLAFASDVLSRIGDAFTNAGKVAADEIVEEAFLCNTSRLIIPDGDSEIIAAATDKTWKKIDAGALGGAVADVLTEAVTVDELDEEQWLDGFRNGAVAGFAAVESYGTVSWRTTDIDALAGELMRHGKDQLASVVRNAVAKGKEPGPMKVARELFKKGRRR